MIEKGRHMQVEKEYRFCPFCLERNVYSIENEFHFFMVCPAYKGLEICIFIQTEDEM